MDTTELWYPLPQMFLLVQDKASESVRYEEQSVTRKTLEETAAPSATADFESPPCL